ncbi:hypothetical protein [Streptomyces chiangmaiensis]|uniref:Uncharacterized protein n=1 Tax=Streptomyces chiangmaiensis TaxID=766497 RepID=A0ABU7FSL9_9ACTN|nr:hypothetical protein [Streptomyces chiangmaiensis]MED7826906.1 hypothetical protein [Streptomyces chiangmaiensis]
MELDLQTNVDTGYTFLGTPFLPPEVTDALREGVEKAIKGDPDADKALKSDPEKIRDACAGRIDSVA